jgi:hypothetical protein
MRETILTILAASLIVGSTFQFATAAEWHTRHLDRARLPASQQFRDSYGAVGGPSLSEEQQYWLNEEAGHVISAPAGRG